MNYNFESLDEEDVAKKMKEDKLNDIESNKIDVLFKVVLSETILLVLSFILEIVLEYFVNECNEKY